jgi:hypothetical protein
MLPASSPVNLLDSGSSISCFDSSALLQGCCPETVDPLTGETMAETLTSSQRVLLSDLTLPELGQNRSVSDSHLRVFSTDCRYDIILGRDILRHFRLILDFDKDIICGPTATQPMRSFPTPYPDIASSLAQHFQLDNLESHLAETNPSPNRQWILSCQALTNLD